MTAHQFIAPLGLWTLDAGCMLIAEAIDPASGANVTGVTVSQFTIYGENVVPDDATSPGASEALPPVYVSLEDEPVLP